MSHPDHLADFLAHLKYERRASAHTLRNYESDLRQFLQHIAPRFCLNELDFERSITRESIRDWLTYLNPNHTKKSIARKLAALRTFCRFLARKGVIASNPAELVASPKREQRLPKYLSQSDTTRLLETPDASTDLGKRDRAILELFYATGIRVSELIDLKLSDLDLSRQVLMVKKHEATTRMIPLGEPARDSLETYLAIRGHLLDTQNVVAPEALFITYLGHQMSPRAVQRLVAKHSNRCSKANPRVLRHSFATHLIDRGLDHRTLQTLLGHKRITTTVSTYSLSFESLREIYDAQIKRPKTLQDFSN